MSRYDAETLATLRQLLIEATFGPTWPRSCHGVVVFTPDPIRWPDEAKLCDELWRAPETGSLTLAHCFQLLERALVYIDHGWSPPPLALTLKGDVRLVEEGYDLWIEHDGQRLAVFALDRKKGWALTLHGICQLEGAADPQTARDEDTLDDPTDDPPRSRP